MISLNVAYLYKLKEVKVIFYYNIFRHFIQKSKSYTQSDFILSLDKLKEVKVILNRILYCL